MPIVFDRMRSYMILVCLLSTFIINALTEEQEKEVTINERNEPEDMSTNEETLR